MNRERIINFAWENDLAYSTEFIWKEKTVLVFSVNSFCGLENFKKVFDAKRVVDSHNENYLIGVVI